MITQRKRLKFFSSFFINQDGLWDCNDVSDLFDAIRITYNIREWKLFIDSSSRSFKDFSGVKILLQTLKYEYGWKVIGEFKIVAFLMSLQVVGFYQVSLLSMSLE